MRTLATLTLVLVCGLASVSSAQAVRTATVEFYIGELHYAFPPDTVFAPASLGQVVEEGVYLRTGEESRAEIRLDDGTLLRMQERTLIQLYAPVPDLLELSGTTVGLETGALYVIKGRVVAGDEFQVRTPIAVAAIRGTEFLDRLLGDENEVQVLRGEVDFTSRADGRKVRVGRGQAGRVLGGFAPATRDLSNAELLDLVRLSEGEPIPWDEAVPDTEGGGVEEPVEEPVEPEEKLEAPDRDEERVGKAGVGYGATVGAVVVNGEIVNQIGLRPEFTIGRVGIGLDLSLYFNAEGELLDEYWDEPEDYLDKIYYLRYAQKGEPFYVRAGALEEVSMGYGLIMRDYSNTIQYPSTIRVGAELGLNRRQFVLEAMFANFRELNEPGVIGGRVAYRPLAGTGLPLVRNLEVGATAVVDGNEYAALEDDLGQDLPDSLYEDHGAFVWGADVGMPVLRSPLVDIDCYAQFAQIDGYGRGLTVPGIRAVAGPLRMEFEYCIFGKQFISDYFNRTYDLQRAQKLPGAGDPYTTKAYLTKEEFLSEEYDRTAYHGGNDGQFQDSKQGWYGALGLNLIDLVDFWGSLQMLGSGSTRDESGYVEAVANTSWIPRISVLSAYAQQSHVPDLFDFQRGPWTVWGTYLGYELAPGASIIIEVRGTYEDLDGDGELEAVRTTHLQTAFQF